MVSEILGEGFIAAVFLGAKFIAAYIAVIWLALVFWTVRDIRQRSRDIWVQAAATFLTVGFFILGYWLYLIVRPRYTLKEATEARYREAILAEYSVAGDCPACHRKTREDYVVCPYCEHTLRKSCVSCSHALKPSWSACPFCGMKVARTGDPSPIPVGSGTKPQASSQPVHA